MLYIIELLLIYIHEFPYFHVHRRSIRMLEYLTVSKMVRGVDNQIRNNVSSLMFVADGNSDFVSTVFQALIWEYYRFKSSHKIQLKIRNKLSTSIYVQHWTEKKRFF